MVGRLDGQTVAQAESALEGALKATLGSALVLNLDGLEYMSSVGLRAILKGAKAARLKGSDMLIAAPSPMVREVLDISGFTSVLQVFATELDAISASSAE